uniref:Uncharacterized protein n=1 Tax=Davidia involucrata TaxID=16924 RepID=A0A5B7CAY1_DAVIN
MVSPQFTSHQLQAASFFKQFFNYFSLSSLYPFPESIYTSSVMEDPMDRENPNMEDLDEAEETLSFCDLLIYSDAVDWEDFSKEDQSSSSSSSSSDQENYFEFFSEEWNTNTPTTTGNIIFCGKLIPYKDPAAASVADELEINKKQQKPKNRWLFRSWNSNSFNKSNSSKSNGTKASRVSILTSPAKSRWYLYAFGLARFPTKMDLGEMKNRQSRQGPSTMFRWDGGDEKLAVGGSRGMGLWGLIRDLGCGGHRHANAVVKASIGCIPRV